jgi:tetratricopeptide (TPR) repeat protein
MRFPAVLLAVLLTASSAEAAGVSPANASPIQREQAQSRFIKGRALYNAKKYDDAIAELRASLDIVASPNTRLYLGRALREQGRIVAAYVELGRAAVEAKELVHEDARYEKAGAAATDERAELAPKLGFVEIKVLRATPETRLVVGDEEIRRAGWDEPVPVVPGTSEIVLETPGRPAVRESVTVAAGERTTATVDAGPEVAATAPPLPETPRSSSLRPAAYATAGIAALGLGTFLVAGALANGTHSDLEKACGAGPCPPGKEDDISSGKTQQTIANVGLVVFGVAAATSITLFVVGSKKSRPSTAIGLGPAFFTARGTF